MTIEQLHEIFLASKGVVTDSRQCKPGTLFFALRGERFDGNDFAIKALNLGCQYAIVDRDNLGDDKRLIVVDNVLTTLQNLACYHRQQFNIPVLAITGTNGKTTTKELINVALSVKYNVLCTRGNLNNQIGVPLTLLQINPEHTFAVIEMGASHPGDIRELCEIAQPNQGLITNIGKAHLEGFGSMEGVIATKCELYDYLKEHCGHIYYNDNNHTLVNAVGDYKRITTYPDKITLVPYQPMMCFAYGYEKHATHIFGDHNFENLLAAMAVSKHSMVDVKTAIKALCKFTPANNRSQLTQSEHNTLIVDAYNANPTSMSNAIRQFDGNPNYGNKVAILGDMLELGESSIIEHRTIIELLKNSNIYTIYMVGTEFGKALKATTFNARNKDKFQHFDNTDALCHFLEKNALANKCILIKGSRGIALEKVIPHL